MRQHVLRPHARFPRKLHRPTTQNLSSRSDRVETVSATLSMPSSKKELHRPRLSPLRVASPKHVTAISRFLLLVFRSAPLPPHSRRFLFLRNAPTPQLPHRLPGIHYCRKTHAHRRSEHYLPALHSLYSKRLVTPLTLRSDGCSARKLCACRFVLC